MSGLTASISASIAVHDRQGPLAQLAGVSTARLALIEGPMAWEGNWLSEDENRYMFELSDTDLVEIEDALAKFKG